MSRKIHPIDTDVMVTIDSLKFDWFSYHKQQRQLSITYVVKEILTSLIIDCTPNKLHMTLNIPNVRTSTVSGKLWSIKTYGQKV